MKMLGIVAIAVGILLIGSFVLVTALQTDEPVEEIECSTCGNSCSAERNCGRASCGAVTGGSCGCGG